MSSKFHVFQLWWTKCLPAGTAHSETDPTFFAPGTGEIQKQSEAPRNRFHSSTGRSSCIQNHSQNALPQVPAGCKTRGIAFPSRIAFPQVLAVPKRIMTMSTMRFPNYWRESRRNRIHPSMGISRSRRKCFAPSTDGIQNQSTARGNRFPPNHTHKRNSESINGMAESE